MPLKRKPEAIIRLLAKGEVQPIYFLQGPEPFYIDEITNQLKELLPPPAKNLNLTMCYGREMTVQKIVNEVNSFAMLGGKKIVIVQNAQEIEDFQKKSGQTILLQYIEQPHADNLLVMAYKGKALPSHSILSKALDKKGFLITSPKVYERDLASWIHSYVATHSYTITPNAAITLQSLLGSQLNLLAKELKKIMINLQPQAKITQDIIMRYVGMHKEFNNFSLQNALCNRDAPKAIEIAQYIGRNSKQYPLLPLLSLLTTFFTKVLQLYQVRTADLKTVAASLKVHPHYMQDYLRATKRYTCQEVINNIHHLHAADRQVKGIDAPVLTESAVLEELVTKIILQP
ncbi:MAG: DNA polymerase III subunit delta [Bacteroidota bacterium]